MAELDAFFGAIAEQELVFWHWWVVAVFMLAIEIMAPGLFFVWLSLAGFVVGIVVFLIPATPIEIQLLLFSALSVISVYIWRYYGFKQSTASDQPLLNKRGNQYIGRVFLVATAIENGYGKIKIADSIWSVEGDDCPLGTKVEIVGLKGAVFTVKRVVST